MFLVNSLPTEILRIFFHVSFWSSLAPWKPENCAHVRPFLYNHSVNHYSRFDWYVWVNRPRAPAPFAIDRFTLTVTLTTPDAPFMIAAKFILSLHHPVLATFSSRFAFAEASSHCRNAELLSRCLLHRIFLSFSSSCTRVLCASKTMNRNKDVWIYNCLLFVTCFNFFRREVYAISTF